MTCHGCRENNERCLFCGRVVRTDHNTAHDVPLNLPTSGRQKEIAQ